MGGWRAGDGKWWGPKRGNLGSQGDREAQTRRQAEKRRAARAAARAAREAAGEVAGKRGRKAKTSWDKRRLIGKQTPRGIYRSLTVARAHAQQARDQQQKAAAKAAALQKKAAALELATEAALQDARAATSLAASAEARFADALNYADKAWESTGSKGPPFLG